MPQENEEDKMIKALSEMEDGINTMNKILLNMLEEMEALEED